MQTKSQEQILTLLDQIIIYAQEHEKLLNEANKLLHRASRSVGEGVVVYHLKVLKDLLLQGDKLPSTIELGKNTFTTCYGTTIGTLSDTPSGTRQKTSPAPSESCVGKKAVVKASHSWGGRFGIIREHYFDFDGTEMFTIQDNNGVIFTLPS